MASYKKNKSGGTQTDGPSNSASPASSVALSNQGINNNAPKYGTLVPNRIFVGGISSNTTEAELTQLFSKYGNVKATKIIADRAGVSKGYGFVTFDTDEEVRCLIQDSNNIVLKERRLNIAPAIKKQPSFNRSFDASSPPPATPNLFFHNGVAYTYHNGMAFFPPTPHQPAIAALPSSADYQSYGPTQNPAPATYGTPVLVPAPPPIFVPQNYSYQPLPMTNGATTQYLYTGAGPANGNTGSPLGASSDNTYMPAPQFFTHPYAAPEAFYQQSMFLYSYNGDYDALEQPTNDGHSSAATSPKSDDSRSVPSPGNLPAITQTSCSPKENDIRLNSNTDSRQNQSEQAGNNKQVQTSNIDSQVPVVSWKNQSEERELCIRDGRRSFYPPQQPPPPPPPPQPPRTTPPMVLYQPMLGNFPSQMFMAPKQNQVPDNMFNQRPIGRGRQRSTISANSMPFIPKFPASFNNNNPLALNNNYNDKNLGEVNNGKSHKFVSNRFREGNYRGSRNGSSPPSKPNPSNVPESFPSPQIVQQPYERQYGSVAPNMGIRWPSQPVVNHVTKRMPFIKRQNGPTSYMAMTANSVRLAKKSQPSVDGDLGGGGDAQPIIELALTPPGSPAAHMDAISKMQALSLESSS